MTNYEALQHLPPKELAIILDQMFCTGWNRASADIKPDDPLGLVATECPFTEAWLNEPAEDALLSPLQPDDDMLLLDAFSSSIFTICFGGKPPAAVSKEGDCFPLVRRDETLAPNAPSVNNEDNGGGDEA